MAEDQQLTDLAQAGLLLTPLVVTLRGGSELPAADHGDLEDVLRRWVAIRAGQTEADGTLAGHLANNGVLLLATGAFDADAIESITLEAPELDDDPDEPDLNPFRRG